MEILSEILPNIIKDFPVEIFRRKFEIIEELVSICARSTASQVYVFHAAKNLTAIIRKFAQTIQESESLIFQDVNLSRAV